MKKYNYIIALLFANFLFAQCDGRYEMEIFDEVEVTTVTYSDIHNLSMDIYQPIGDDVTNRPLIILAHGGTFIFGSKNNPTVVELCETFAKRGYVTASINYRLANDIVGLFQQFTFYTNTESAYEVVLNAMMDGKAAVRYFRKDVAENGNIYGIDPDQIWAGGNSAGGVLFLHVGHVQSIDEFIAPLDDNRANIATSVFNSIGGDIEGNSGNSGYSSEISGVISLAGALHRSEYVDSNDIPSIFAHGDNDGVVPYDCNGFQNNPSYDQLCGGGALINNFQNAGIPSDLLTFPGDNHCPWDADSNKMSQVISFVSDFVYQNIDCDQNTGLEDIDFFNGDIMYEFDLLGRKVNNDSSGIIFSVYSNGKVEKKYIINK